MEYYNEGETPNHKMIKIKNINNLKKRGYKHSSTDNIFNNKKGISLDKIYNKFLTNPYLVRNSRYINALNSINYTRDDTKYFNNNNYDNNPKSEEKTYENMKEKEITYDKSDELNNYLKYEDNHNNNFQMEFLLFHNKLDENLHCIYHKIILFLLEFQNKYNTHYHFYIFFLYIL